MRKSIAHELTQEETRDLERNQLLRYQKRLHMRRFWRMLVALYPWVRRRIGNTPRSRNEVDGAL